MAVKYKEGQTNQKKKSKHKQDGVHHLLWLWNECIHLHEVSNRINQLSMHGLH